MFNREVHLSTAMLAAVGLFDLVVSFMLFRLGFAEGNLLFKWLLSQGQLYFTLGKVVFLAGPIVILEYARNYEPKVAETGTWVALGLYLVFFVGHVLTALW